MRAWYVALCLMVIAQITQILPIIDKASVASDRWLFLGILLVLLIGCCAVIKWLVKSMEDERATHAGAMAVKDTIHAAERKEFMAELNAERVTAREQRTQDQTRFIDSLKAIEAQSRSGEIQSKAHTAALEELTSEIRKISHRQRDS